jgi:hypothetical protein
LTECMHHSVEYLRGKFPKGRKLRDAMLHTLPTRSIRRRSRYAPALLLLVPMALVACGSSSGTSNAGTAAPKASASVTASQNVSANPAAGASVSSTGLAPNPNGPVARCLLGGRPVNIEFYGVDADSVCSKYVPVLAALGLGELPVHLDSNATDIPAGFTEGCFLSYPLSFGNLYATVDGYTNGDLVGDPGPLATKVCAKLKKLGWAGG